MNISNDLKDLLSIKRGRKSSVMMAVMFLIISAVVATPFALGMVSVYAGFMESFAQMPDLITTALISSQLPYNSPFIDWIDYKHYYAWQF